MKAVVCRKFYEGCQAVKRWQWCMYIGRLLIARAIDTSRRGIYLACCMHGPTDCAISSTCSSTLARHRMTVVTPCTPPTISCCTIISLCTRCPQRKAKLREEELVYLKIKTREAFLATQRKTKQMANRARQKIEGSKWMSKLLS